jgi:precorrin-6Y C5,15-methyltransferase (decarboxylating)
VSEGEQPVDVVGVGADGWAALSGRARALLDTAEVVVGGRRHLEGLVVGAGQQVVTWPSPMLDDLPRLVRSWEGRRVVVLASGDPLVSGVGSTLVGLLGAERVRVHPAVSSVSLARARLGWSAEGSDAVTLVGRDVDRLRRDLSPRARLVLLVSGAETPRTVSRVLVEEGYGGSVVTVLGDLGGADETRVEGPASELSTSWDAGLTPRLYVLGVECRPAAGASVSPAVVPGLPDESFEHDGQLTKRLVRAAALAHLAPRPGDVMWDLGAGAGSVGIEFARAHPRNEVHAVERDTARAERIGRNARRLGVPALRVVTASALSAVDTLPPPDAVFVGGGADAEVVERAWTALRPGGRLVVHAVTVETELVLHAARRAHGGSLVRLSVEEVGDLGSFTGWSPARAIVQWSTSKPWGQWDPSGATEGAGT